MKKPENKMPTKKSKIIKKKYKKKRKMAQKKPFLQCIDPLTENTTSMSNLRVAVSPNNSMSQLNNVVSQNNNSKDKNNNNKNQRKKREKESMYKHIFSFAWMNYEIRHVMSYGCIGIGIGTMIHVLRTQNIVSHRRLLQYTLNCIGCDTY